MVRTQIQLTEAQVRELKKLAADYQMSMAALIRDSIDEMLKSRHQVSREEQRQRALAVAGKYRSGKSDISKRHDHYLTGIYGNHRK